MLFEHWGDNRSFKTGGNALFAWLAYLQDKTVYCNCPQSLFDGSYNCILNFPHEHIDPGSDLFRKELYDCYLMTDQGESAGLESLHIDNEVKQAYRFGLQATKSGVDWHYDTVRHKSIVNRLRLNVHFYIQSIRYPQDPRKPLVAVKIRIKSRYSAVPKSFWIMKPQVLFPLFNSEVQIRPKIKETEKPGINEIHKILVGA